MSISASESSGSVVGSVVALMLFLEGDGVIGVGTFFDLISLRLADGEATAFLVALAVDLAFVADFIGCLVAARLLTSLADRFAARGSECLVVPVDVDTILLMSFEVKAVDRSMQELKSRNCKRSDLS